MTIHVEVITQEGRLFEEQDADMVIVPGSEGVMGVLPHHAPVLTTMGFGELRIRKGDAERWEVDIAELARWGYQPQTQLRAGLAAIRDWYDELHETADGPKLK